jgi:RNA recognition motif-containing protein
LRSEFYPGTPRRLFKKFWGFPFNGRGGEMNLKLYVGNIPFGASEEDLRKLFSEAGVVQSAKIVVDAYSGRPRGFGFVEMGSESDAEKAISLLNGKTFMERALTVNEAKPQKKKEDNFRGRRDRNR